MTTAPAPAIERGERAAQRAVALAEGWTRWYTGHVPGDAAERRRAEIESDLWEQLADGRESSTAPGAIAASVTWRVLAGVPADLSWVRQQRAMTRGASNREKESTMNTFARLAGRWWWVVLAVVAAASYAVIAIGNLSEPGAPYLEGATLALACAALILVGAVLRAWFPFAGGLLVVAGAGPGALLWWVPLLASLAALVVVGALIDLVILPAARRRIGAPAAVGRVVALVGAFFAMAVPLMIGVVPGLLVTGLIAAALIVVAIVRRNRPAPTATAAAA
ncbi:MAG TPA: hypothetical protein VF479_04895 [Pseudolysinimonas sp.]